MIERGDGRRLTLATVLRMVGHVGALVSFHELVSDYFRYCRPGFHPNHRDSRELVQRSRESLFGSGGLLESGVKVIPRRMATIAAATLNTMGFV